MAAQLIILPGGLSGHRIGPNAILRVADVLRADEGEQCTRALFARAGLERYLDDPPGRMVDEREVVVLHRTLWASLGPLQAMEVERRAGAATAQYLLRRRIPHPFQYLLRLLPARLAGPLLLSTLTRRSWTYAGSARVTASFGTPLLLLIENNPMCRGTPAPDPECLYYASAFERLFRVLVDARVRVHEVQCEARGDSACCFEIHTP